jgi:hypothetical protein
VAHIFSDHSQEFFLGWRANPFEIREALFLELASRPQTSGNPLSPLLVNVCWTDLQFNGVSTPLDLSAKAFGSIDRNSNDDRRCCHEPKFYARQLVLVFQLVDNDYLNVGWPLYPIGRYKGE